MLYAPNVADQIPEIHNAYVDFFAARLDFAQVVGCAGDLIMAIHHILPSTPTPTKSPPHSSFLIPSPHKRHSAILQLVLQKLVDRKGDGLPRRDAHDARRYAFVEGVETFLSGGGMRLACAWFLCGLGFVCQLAGCFLQIPVPCEKGE